MCFSSPKAPPSVQMSPPPEPTLPTAAAPLEAKKKKKTVDEKPILPQDAMVSALGIPTFSTNSSPKNTPSSTSDYK